MKRIIFILLVLVVLGLSVPALTYADALPPLGDPCAETNKENQILPCRSVNGADGKTVLPTKNLKLDILPQAIKIVLAAVGSVSVIVFVYAGVMLIISQGNEEELTKFKNVLLWSVIGLLFVTTSYGLVRGILQLVLR